MKYLRNLAVYLWRLIRSYKLKRNGVYVSPNTHFDPKSVFEGKSRIGVHTVVSGSNIGKYTYISANTILPNCKIGRFCSIGQNVCVVPDSHPSSVFVSTCPSFYSTSRQNGQTFVKENKYEEHLSISGYDVIIGNDVWIGNNVIIKGGIRIGDGAIIAMGAVATKDVPPYSIVGGVPARLIKYRFEQEQIDKLLAIKWWDKPEDWIISHADDFDNIKKFLAE